jgi:hypothetical protein
MNGRYLSFATVVRVRQIETTRDAAEGPDESSAHRVTEAKLFRETIEKVIVTCVVLCSTVMGAEVDMPARRDSATAVLKPDALRKYVETFNGKDHTHSRRIANFPDDVVFRRGAFCAQDPIKCFTMPFPPLPAPRAAALSIDRLFVGHHTASGTPVQRLGMGV